MAHEILALKALHNGGDALLGYDIAYDKTYVIIFIN